MTTDLYEPDVLDYVTFVTILIGIVCNILIIDTIVHKLALRSGMRLIIISWSICDLFYLFNTSGFLHLLFESFGLHVPLEKIKTSIFQPHLLEEAASGLLLQIICLMLMWILAFSSVTNTKSFVHWFVVVASVVIDLLIVFLRYDLASYQINSIRRAYIAFLLILIVVNEFHYFQLMCEDEMDIDEVAMKLLKINIIRVYVYNWSFVYFMKYIVAFSFHDAITSHAAAKYFYVLAICLSLTAFLTGLYVLIHLLCNDLVFRKFFTCWCTSLRRQGNSINSDQNEMTAFLMGNRRHYMYHTEDI